MVQEASAMHIYLKNGDQQRWLIVELVDGHMPRLSGFSLSHSQVAETLEPAIWFKLMVIDSISIDCQNCVVSWNVLSEDSTAETRYLMFENEDQSCYDFNDDIDELFHLATFLIRSNPMAVLNKRDRNILIDEYERSLFRMLHCYILGKITLQPEDIIHVEHALETQNHAIYLLDDSILMHKRTEIQILSEMRDLREARILPFFEKVLVTERTCDELVPLLEANVTKDLGKVRNEFDVAQRRVDTIKQDMGKGAVSKEFSATLVKARGKRDIAWAKVHQLMEWKEMLASCKKKKRRLSIKNSPPPIILRYFELHQKVTEEKRMGRVFCDKKVRASSVRESIEKTLRDLRAGYESAGIDISVCGQKSTDVISENGPIAEWQTFTERLASILYNKDHPVGLLFADLLENISTRCTQILSTFERLANTNYSALDAEGFFDVNKGSVCFSEDLEAVKSTIQAHLDQSIALLMDCFKRKDQMFAQKLQLGYEKFLYQEVGSYVLQIYRVVNGNVMVSLEERVTRLRDFPVCALGLQMKNEWWVSLFEPVPSQNASCSVESDDDIDGPESCHKNLDLMREKLQVGTANVLSRSYSHQCVSDMTDGNLVRFGAYVMAKEIESNVAPKKDFVPLSQLIGSLRRVNVNRSVVAAAYERGRTRSTPSLLSMGSPSSSPDLGYASPSRNLTRKDSFQRHFGQVIAAIRKVFDVKTPLSKMQQVTTSLRKLNEKVGELRRSGPDAITEEANVISRAVSGDELLPLIVLLLLKLTPSEVGKLFIEVCFMCDLMANFLSHGCHSYSLTMFQMAFRVLNEVCEELKVA